MAEAGKKKVVKRMVAKSTEARPMKKLRMDIGVRNPYALANATLKQVIGWRRWTGSQRDTLFRWAFNLSFVDLFDSAKRRLSPVYACQAAAQCPTANWATSTSWFYQDEYHGSDPVQGAACDCYFIAALSSIAWTCRSGVIKKDDTTNPSYYTMRFYDDTAAPPVTAYIGVSKDLPVINNSLVYARSSTPNETWPSYYEKAYAQFYANRGNNPSTTLVTTLPQTVLNALCTAGNPLASLFHIAKPWGYTTKTVKYPPADYTDAGAMWTAISNLTSGNKTKFPAVAWTYVNETEAAEGLGQTLATWQQNWGNYAGDRIIAQHSYSILGTFLDPSNNKKYVVLRNSFGPDQGDPRIPQLYTGTWSYTLRFYKAGGALNTAIRPVLGEQNSIDLSIPDGVFALEAEAFRAYFEAFGWVS